MGAMAQGRRRGERRRALHLVGGEEASDDELVEALRAGEPWAKRLFFDRYAPLVERTLRRILGRERHEELADLIHDVFVQALDSLERLRDPKALPAWVRSVAANTACRAIRRRKARRWLRFWEPSALPHPPAHDTPPEVREAYVRTYALLDRLSAEHRVAFVLRHLEGLKLQEVADACGVSLATIKRRLGRAEATFLAGARADPALAEWVEGGGRWAR